MMNFEKKNEKAKQIIQTLLDTGKTRHSKLFIEQTIIKTVGCLDPRTIHNWFRYMWVLGLFERVDSRDFQIQMEVCVKILEVRELCQKTLPEVIDDAK